MDAGVARDDEQIPVKGHGGRVRAGFLPAQNLPVLVFRPRVGPAHRLTVFAAPGVVGQRAIDLTVSWADHYPFRPVHSRCLDLACRQTRMNQHLSLVGKTVRGIDTVLSMGQLDPSALALGMIREAVAV